MLLRKGYQRSLLRKFTSSTEVADSEALALMTGISVDSMKRKVRIFIPPQSTMQSGVNQSTFWRIGFMQEDSPRWANNLMGWTSTRDPIYNISTMMRFETKEAAIAYAEKHGFEYEVNDTPGYGTKLQPKNYGHNFAFKKDPKPEDDIF